MKTKNQDNVVLEEINGRPICRSQVWIIKKGIGAGNRNVRSITDKGIAGLSSSAEIETIMWGKGQIFREDAFVRGNVLFVFAQFKIFMMKSRGLGKWKKFFYNAKQAAISVAELYSEARNEVAYLIFDIYDENLMIAELAQYFNRRRDIYETGFIDIRREIEKVDARLYTPQICDYAAKENLRGID